MTSDRRCRSARIRRARRRYPWRRGCPGGGRDRPWDPTSSRNGRALRRSRPLSTGGRSTLPGATGPAIHCGPSQASHGALSRVSVLAVAIGTVEARGHRSVRSTGCGENLPRIRRPAPARGVLAWPAPPRRNSGARRLTKAMRRRPGFHDPRRQGVRRWRRGTGVTWGRLVTSRRSRPAQMGIPALPIEMGDGPDGPT
jgi:hypothetical protein